MTDEPINRVRAAYEKSRQEQCAARESNIAPPWHELPAAVGEAIIDVYFPGWRDAQRRKGA